MKIMTATTMMAVLTGEVKAPSAVVGSTPAAAIRSRMRVPPIWDAKPVLNVFFILQAKPSDLWQSEDETTATCMSAKHTNMVYDQWPRSGPQ
jgi:hypothetical protein